MGFFGLEPSSIEIAPALTRWITEKQKRLGSTSSRRERIAVLKWLARIPEQFDAYFRELWRLGFGKDRLPSLQRDRMEERMRELLRLYTRVVEKLPGAFAQIDHSERERGCFAEVFPALQREATACFEASRTLVNGLDVQATDGSRLSITFSTAYSALEVSEHLRILRMAAEELVIQFPIDEVEESQREQLPQAPESL